MLPFEKVLPSIIAAYDQGRLVPFIGAGASAGACVMWEDFVGNLEVAAGMRPRCDSDLVQRAARAVRKLKNDEPPGTNRFFQAVRKSLPTDEPIPPPLPSLELAKFWWPLVVSTNYDDWFYKLWNSKHATLQAEEAQEQSWNQMIVCGRSRSDCQRILMSLGNPDNPLLWAVQGFLGGQAKQNGAEPPNIHNLESQIAIGHEEYRREALANQHFRRCFGEVYRSRSFLFIGSNLAEHYFRSLFDETIEFHGSNPTMHFAFIRIGEVDTEFLVEQYQIQVIEFNDFTELPKLISQFYDNLTSHRPRVISWSFSLLDQWPIESLQRPPVLKIKRRKLPMSKQGEAVLLGCRIKRRKHAEPMFGELVKQTFKENYEGAELNARDVHRVEEPSLTVTLWRHDRFPQVFFLEAQQNALALRHYFERALRHLGENYEGIQAVLLTAGTRKYFPPFVAVVEMVRGFSAAFREPGVPAALKYLTINLHDGGVLAMFRGGRLSITELLSAGPFRIVIEILKSETEVFRSLELVEEETAITNIRKKYNLPDKSWDFEMIPRLNETGLGRTNQLIRTRLRDIGLFPGATLRFRRRTANPM
jgi:hypothetical protein